MFRKSVLLAILAYTLKGVQSSCVEVGGNYYCDQTSAVLYSGIGFSGSYSDITAMDENSGSCSSSSKSFSGTLAPLDEELSVHFRGPLNLKQFAVYYPSSSSSYKKRDAEAESEDCSTTQHVHHVHKRAPATKIVEVTETVIVDQYGNTHTSAGVVTTTLPSTSAAVGAGVQFAVSEEESSSSIATTSSTYSPPYYSPSSSSSSSSSSSASSSSSSSSVGGWERTSYFTPGSTTNVTFLNTLGGSGSGVWSAALGNSLSYCGSDGVSSSSSAVALDDVTIDSDVEYVIFSGSSCDDTSTGDCGYYREGIPAYHGFAGTEKIFLFEFEMPTATDSTSNNHDMPAIWLLNAKIPRTSQYGSSSCSCWSSGCGELDLFEILSSGSSKLISHLHDGLGDSNSAYGGGGSQDYFARPTSSSAYGAAVFTNGNVYVLMLDSLDFGSSLDASTIESWISGSISSATLL